MQPLPTLLEVVTKTTDFFRSRGVESARLNAELLIGHALGLKRMQLYLQFERVLAEPELEKIRPLVRRRGKREPLQHILGEVEFGGLRLKSDRRALIPRPETELLVETVVGRRPASAARVLDLGTGSGAIALALAKAWPEAEVVAADTSEEALALGRENAEAAGLAGRVTFIVSRWFEGLPEGRFDVIVSNPPYLSAEEAARAPAEVREFEPYQALVAEEGGLADLRLIVRQAPGRLAPGGLLALETGPEQHAELLALAAAAGLTGAESLRDLAGRDRFILAGLPPP
ncbi:MAG TPA: peptide chain release factor N(5)-glutamine methyltransferase [Opitutaceae bacterium]|nr:peptide chain release factor N(5)-glutamine methyltransferase [Opitutaceae bacterium]